MFPIKNTIHKVILLFSLLLLGQAVNIANANNLNSNAEKNNINNTISENSPINDIEDFKLFYERKGKGNYIIKGYVAKEENGHEEFKQRIQQVENFFTKENSSVDFTYLFRKIDVNFYISKDFSLATYSYMEDKEIRSCYINIKYGDENEFLFFESLEKETYFTLNHELAHCYLGKEIFEDANFWKYEIDASTKKILSNIIAKKTVDNISYLGGKVFYNGPLPLIVYHEMFADTFATLLMLKNKQFSASDIDILINKRLKSYEDLGTNPKSSYLGFKPLTQLKEMMKKTTNPSFTNMSIEEIKEISEMLSQKYFIEYLLT